MSQIVNFPEFLAIKWERKVLETQFWYQKKALLEQNLNKLFWQQINIHKVSKSPKPKPLVKALKRDNLIAFIILLLGDVHISHKS